MTNTEILLKAVRHKGYNVLSLALIKDIIFVIADVLDKSDMIIVNKHEFKRLLEPNIDENEKRTTKT